MGIGVGKGGLVWSLPYAQMLHIAHKAGQAPADLPLALGPRQLTEQHRDKMVPRIELFSIPPGSILDDELVKPPPVEQAHQLTEKARTPYHLSASWFGVSECLVNLPAEEAFWGQDSSYFCLKWS